MGTPEQSTTGGPEASWVGRVAGLAGSCHPGPVVAVTALMAGLAVTAGQAAERVLTGAAVLTGQLETVPQEGREPDRAEESGEGTVPGVVKSAVWGCELRKRRTWCAWPAEATPPWFTRVHGGSRPHVC
ncbi:hypothetical protein ACFVJ4_41325 [Streptomyces sp. NPDC127178]|uniref:hypothetical protein n=1 Tax=Streptomyces sp. NPDC127178 TaxID=3345385 RepID=UPI00362F95E2